MRALILRKTNLPFYVSCTSSVYVLSYSDLCLCVTGLLYWLEGSLMLEWVVISCLVKCDSSPVPRKPDLVYWFFEVSFTSWVQSSAALYMGAQNPLWDARFCCQFFCTFTLRCNLWDIGQVCFIFWRKILFYLPWK